MAVAASLALQHIYARTWVHVVTYTTTMAYHNYTRDLSMLGSSAGGKGVGGLVCWWWGGSGGSVLLVAFASFMWAAGKVCSWRRGQAQCRELGLRFSYGRVGPHVGTGAAPFACYCLLHGLTA